MAMHQTIAYRGPDDAGIYIDPTSTVGFAHRRLSILDLSPLGHQPMPSADGMLHITFNGEIYNYWGIREELIEKNYQFKGHSDTEVILYAYQEWGEACLQRFNGMFAFAIHDARQNKIFMARDRFGIKPFHYGFLNDGSFVFASEIKAMMPHPAFQKNIFYPALGDFLKYRYIPAPRTIWENIFKLEHGYCAVYDLNTFEFSKKPYYNLLEAVKNRPPSTLDEVKERLFHAVQAQMVSDVDVGVFLSGGMDSSAISAISKEIKPEIKSFSIGFKPEQYSELPYSKEVAHHLNIDHVTETIDKIDENILDKIAFHYDEPLADSSCIPTYILCQMTAKHVKVVLSGDGGDEVFSGYNWYEQYRKDYHAYACGLIGQIRRLFQPALPHLPEFEKYYNKLLLNRFDEKALQECFTAEAYEKVSAGKIDLMEDNLAPHLKSVRNAQYVDMNSFMIDDILVKVDRASMAHSIEARVPLLDHELVEAVFALPEDVFPSDATGKPVLKKMMRDRLPKQVFKRKKQGFSTPLNALLDPHKVAKKLENGLLVQNNVIKSGFIQDLLDGKYSNANAMMYMLLFLEKWWQQWGRA